MTAKLHEEAMNEFIDGYRCSEAILKIYGREFGLNRQMAMKMGCALGGGLGSSGNICGALLSSILILGLKIGRTDKDDKASVKKTDELVTKYIEKFKLKHKCIKCNDLIGFDRSTEEGHKQAEESGVFKKRCPQIVKDAALILEDFLRDH